MKTKTKSEQLQELQDEAWKERHLMRSSTHREIWIDAIEWMCSGDNLSKHLEGKLISANLEKQVLEDYFDWYKKKYGGEVMVNNYWIEQFITGE